LNETCVDIIDACIRKDNSRVFTQRVRKNEAPDYFDIVKDPIDFSIMRGKAKRKEYTSTELFLQDFILLRANAEKYNGGPHAISQMARDIEKIAIEMTANARQNEL
jgi:bromodomain-containing protein 7/9